jgi:hypothetical protein
MEQVSFDYPLGRPLYHLHLLKTHLRLLFGLHCLCCLRHCPRLPLPHLLLLLALTLPQRQLELAQELNPAFDVAAGDPPAPSPQRYVNAVVAGLAVRHEIVLRSKETVDRSSVFQNCPAVVIQLRRAILE